MYRTLSLIAWRIARGLLPGFILALGPGSGPGRAQDAPPPVLGSCYWGMTTDQVKEAVRLPVLSTDTDGPNRLLAYSDQFCDMTCIVQYMFSPEGLVEILIEPQEDQTLEEHLTRYHALRDCLRAKYGTGEETETPDDSNPQLTVHRTFWDTPAAYVTVALHEGFPGMLLGVTYDSGYPLAGDEADSTRTAAPESTETN